MLHAEYVFEVEKRRTSTFASMYVKLWQQQGTTAYLIYLKWLLRLAILPRDQKAGLVTPSKCQWSKRSRRNVHLGVLFWRTPLHHLQPWPVLKERRTYRHSLPEVLEGGQRIAFAEKRNSKTQTLTVQHTAEVRKEFWHLPYSIPALHTVTSILLQKTAIDRPQHICSHGKSPGYK